MIKKHMVDYLRLKVKHPFSRQFSGRNFEALTHESVSWNFMLAVHGYLFLGILNTLDISQ